MVSGMLNSTIFIVYSRILTTIADADWYEEENVQQHALKTILNCVQNTHIYKGAFRLDTKRSRVSASELSESEKIIWECLRKHDIIMVFYYLYYLLFFSRSLMA